MSKTVVYHWAKYRNFRKFSGVKFCGNAQFPQSLAICPKLCRNCTFLQNFYTRKLGEITVFYAVYIKMERKIFIRKLYER